MRRLFVLVALIALVAPPAIAQVVINELDYDSPSGPDRAEFIEVKNTGAAPVNLDDYHLLFANGDAPSPGPGIYLDIDLPNVVLAAGGYFVVCGHTANVLNCDLDLVANDAFQNGFRDAVALTLSGVIVDAVAYEGQQWPGYFETAAFGGTDSNVIPNIGISRLPDGADTNNNSVDFSIRCITPGSRNVTQSTTCAATTIYVPPPESVPTLSEWMMILFGVLLAGGAAVHIQRSRMIG